MESWTGVVELFLHVSVSCFCVSACAVYSPVTRSDYISCLVFYSRRGRLMSSNNLLLTEREVCKQKISDRGLSFFVQTEPVGPIFLCRDQASEVNKRCYVIHSKTLIIRVLIPLDVAFLKLFYVFVC